MYVISVRPGVGSGKGRNASTLTPHVPFCRYLLGRTGAQLLWSAQDPMGHCSPRRLKVGGSVRDSPNGTPSL